MFWAGPAGAGPLVAHSPAWSELSPADQRVLAPLAADWDKLEVQRKEKWLGIAKRYPTLPPPQQERIQAQMSAWARLTPDERRVAREQFRACASCRPSSGAKSGEKWREYQQLPPEKRRELAAPSIVRPATAASPPPATATPAAEKQP